MKTLKIMQKIDLSAVKSYINTDYTILIDCWVSRCKVQIESGDVTIAQTDFIDIDEIIQFVLTNKVNNYAVCGDCDGIARFIQGTSD